MVHVRIAIAHCLSPMEKNAHNSCLISCLLCFCRQEILQLDNEIVFNEAIIEEREQGIQEIQQQIGEVNEIFKDLAVLVHDQGIMIGEFMQTCIFI